MVVLAAKKNTKGDRLRRWHPLLSAFMTLFSTIIMLGGKHNFLPMKNVYSENLFIRF
jgi:hypothetical protein